MQRRKFDAKTKSAIVLEGLKGRSVADICNEYPGKPDSVLQVARPVFI